MTPKGYTQYVLVFSFVVILLGLIAAIEEAYDPGYVGLALLLLVVGLAGIVTALYQINKGWRV